MAWSELIPPGLTVPAVPAVLSLLWTVLPTPVLPDLRQASSPVQEFMQTLEMDLQPLLPESRLRRA